MTVQPDPHAQQGTAPHAFAPSTPPGEMVYAETVLDLIGRTPLVKLNKVTEGITATVLVKLEYLNPGASVKDRIALKMLEEAEADGRLVPGGTVVEPTSGNTGVGLAMVAQQKGYRSVFVTPDKVGQEKRDVLKAYGAEVVVTKSSVPPESAESYYGVADRLEREIPGAYQPNQFFNPAAPVSHYESTGPELWQDTAGRLTHFVAGAGTGGTVTGAGRYLKEISADRNSGPVQIVVADPDGSIYSGGEGRPYFIEGVGEDMMPGNYDASIPDQVHAVTDAESMAMTRRLAAEEGLLVGGSSGMAVVAGLRVAERLGPDDVMVILLPDSGRGYLAKIFNDAWMDEQGFTVEQRPSVLPAGTEAESESAAPEATGRDRTTRETDADDRAGGESSEDSGYGPEDRPGQVPDRGSGQTSDQTSDQAPDGPDAGGGPWHTAVAEVLAEKKGWLPGSLPDVVTAPADTTLAEAISTMNRWGVDALPVVHAYRDDLRIGEILGTVAVDALAASLAAGHAAPSETVADHMDPVLPKINASATLAQAHAALRSASALLVTRDGVVAGIITLHDILARVAPTR